MPNFIVFKKSSRLAVRGYSQDDPPNVNSDEQAIETTEQILYPGYKVVSEDGRLVPIAAPPGIGHTWDGTQWVPPPPDPVAAGIEARQRRDQLMAATIDRVNALWLSSMSPEEQGECADFRQKLLDITSQTGYPFDIVWPEIPKILTFSEGGA